MKKSFSQNVYEIVAKIPKGNVATYGQIAKLAGNSRAARAVGMCMKHNKNPRIVPCHRVVARDGSLTGYSMGEGIKTKKEKLIQEGVFFHKNKVDLSKSLWKQ